MKDHEIAKVVNNLRDIAKEYGQTQQLRSRIGSYIVPILKGESLKLQEEYTSNGTYKKGVDPEVTCWHCKKTFLCDCMDATCRLCGAPYDKNRCKEFNFKCGGCGRCEACLKWKRNKFCICEKPAVSISCPNQCRKCHLPIKSPKLGKS